MLSAILKYNPIGKKFLAFEQAENEQDSFILGVEVVQKKEELDLVEPFTINDLKEYTQSSSNRTKAHLMITDSNVLSKEIEAMGSDQEILAEAYPNLDLDDFYYQILKTSKKSFIAICRKKYVDTIITTYKKANIQVTSIDLGNLKATSLLSYIQEEEFFTYTGLVSRDDHEISSIQSNNETRKEYQIDSIKIPSTHTLPFAGILDLITNQASITGNIEEKNTFLSQVYKESQRFKKILQYGIGFLLISLLINFFVFNNAYKKWQNLQEEEQIYTTQKETIKKQQSAVSTKENIVNSILTTGFSKSSFFIDRIIQSLPSSVVLKSCAYQPTHKTIRSDKPIAIKKNLLIIAGNSSDKTGFTNWVDTIENLDFVQNTTINYGFDKKNTSAFEIAIQLINDAEK